MSGVTVALEIEGESASLINGQGALVVQQNGIAGTLSRISSGGYGLSAGGTLIVRINNTGGAVDTSIGLDGSTIRVLFTADEGSLFRFAGQCLHQRGEYPHGRGLLTFETRTDELGVDMGRQQGSA